MTIRPVRPADIPALGGLAEARRQEYARYAPTFWHPAPQARQAQEPYFLSLLDNPDFILLLNDEEADGGSVDGFIIGHIQFAPPVYDPGSRVISIDDFTVARPDLWPTVGRNLLAAVRAQAAERGAQLTIVVCGQLDEPKRAFLRAQGFAVTSEWYVNPL